MKLKRPSDDDHGVDDCFSNSSATLNTNGLKVFPVVDSAQATINDVLACYAALSALPSLEPSPKVNEAFSRLVSICLSHFDPSVEDEILSSPRVQAIKSHLLTICSLGESCLERFWAEKITLASQNYDGNNPNLKTSVLGLLSTFPYHSNYVDLTALELRALSTAIDLKQIRRIAFIGSGPLPLSSICLLQQLMPQLPKKNSNSISSNDGNDNLESEVSVVNIDRCPSAIYISRTLTLQMGGSIAKNMHFLHAAAKTTPWPSGSLSESSSLSAGTDSQADAALGLEVKLRNCDVVFLAALVGENVTEKRAVLQSLAMTMRKGSVVVVRTARGLKGLLYPIIEAGHLPATLEVVTVSHPNEEDGVINSVIVARVRS